jgi:hypothetical protein
MKRTLIIFIKAIIIAAIIVVPLTGTVIADDNIIDTVVSPNVLNIESKGGSISVHTDVGYASKENVTLEVNGNPIENIYTFTDNCGNLVVKCNIDTVKTIVTGEAEANFILIVNYDSEIYTGTDTIAVIQVIPQKS